MTPPTTYPSAKVLDPSLPSVRPVHGFYFGVVGGIEVILVPPTLVTVGAGSFGCGAVNTVPGAAYLVSSGNGVSLCCSYARYCLCIWSTSVSVIPLAKYSLLDGL